MDSQRQRWKVYERERKRFDGRAAIVLIFESVTAVRCVHTYPEGAVWRRKRSNS